MPTSQTQNVDSTADPKYLSVVPVEPPASEFRVQRNASLPTEGARKTRYSLPQQLRTSSPVGYRTRISLNQEEGQYALQLLSLTRPSQFLSPEPIREEELFEECSLGVLLSRQSTNFRGHRQSTLGPKTSEAVARLLNRLEGRRVPPLENSNYTHLLFTRPYRTPFTMLLTLLGHRRWLSLVSVIWRIIQKRFLHKDDIPTIGYLQYLHIGILADGMERATVLASEGRRRAQIHMAPFCGDTARQNREVIREIEELGGLLPSDRRKGWKLALVSQVGTAIQEERIEIPTNILRKIAANFLAFRSERIQPGVNQEARAPEGYQKRQPMDVPDELTVMAGRAAYNAFAHWTTLPREEAKQLLILDRIDVLTPNGKERLRSLRSELNGIADRVVADIPLWADLPTGRVFSKNAARSKKAFALTCFDSDLLCPDLLCVVSMGRAPAKPPEGTGPAFLPDAHGPLGPREWHSGLRPRTGVSLSPTFYPSAKASLCHLDQRRGCGLGHLIPSSSRFPGGPSASCGSRRRGDALLVACASSVATRVVASGPLRHRRGVKSLRERSGCLRRVVPSVTPWGPSLEGRDGSRNHTSRAGSGRSSPMLQTRGWDGGA